MQDHYTHRVVMALAAAMLVTHFAFAGSISGSVKMEGKPPTPKIVDRSADAKCIELHAGELKTETFVTGESDGESTLVANVFVYVSAGLAGKKHAAPAEPVVLNQVGCRYVPHVIGLQVGQTLQIKNSDATTHNIHSLAKNNKQFNNGQPKGSPPLNKVFDAEEVMCKIKCDMHPWMSCYVGVLPHPYFAVTDASGSYKIDNLPAGDYEITAWHEKMRTRTAKVTVADGDVSSDFRYTKKKKK